MTSQAILPVTGSTMTSLFGATIPTTLTGLTPHTWVADANGQYQTTTDLAAEWEAAYAKMLDGQAATLTPEQRVEGNAEAVFENTAIAKLPAGQIAIDRADAQREFDAIAGAMKIDQTLYGIDPNAQFTQQTLLTLEHTLQGTPALEELAIQGHGLNNPPAARYEGFTNNFQNADPVTRFIGGGVNNGQNALSGFADDNIMSHVPFPTIYRNGELVQLDQNGDAESSLAQQVAGLNETMYTRVLTAKDFTTAPPPPPKTPTTSGQTVDPVVVTAPTPPTMKTLTGFTISTTITGITVHTWTADGNGLFTTSANLAQEWQGFYTMMLDGQGGALTPVERLEGNAEAVFENTGLSKLSAAVQEQYREDAQREFDAIGAAMQIDATTLGISATAAFTTASYVALEHTLQANPALEELAIQGHGLTKPPSARYDGYVNDFQDNVDTTTKYVGGGVDNGKSAVATFFDDDILSNLPFSSIYRNGTAVQLNQTGQTQTTLADAIAGLNQSMFYQVYVASDFKA